MPTYEYRCRTCGHRFDQLQPMSASALTHCPVSECIQEDESLKGKGEVERLVSGGAGLVFKGEGFYLTDYGKKGSGGGGGSKKESGGSKESGGGSKESGGGSKESGGGGAKESG